VLLVFPAGGLSAVKIVVIERASPLGMLLQLSLHAGGQSRKWNVTRGLCDNLSAICRHWERDWGQFWNRFGPEIA